MYNFRESKLVFFAFEGGKANDFVPKIQAIEKKVQEEKEKTTPESGKADIVDEAQVKEKIEGIEKKIKESPVSDEYKDQIEKSLTTLLDKKEKDLKRVDVKKEDKLKALFDKILVDLDGFKDQPEVKDIYETIEPFFKNKDKIKSSNIFALQTYRRNSGHWEVINKKLEEQTGIKRDQVFKIQKILGCRIDGKVGPETINAISEMTKIGLSEVKYDNKATKYIGADKSIEEQDEEKGEKSKEDSTVTDGKAVPAKSASPDKNPKSDVPASGLPKESQPKVNPTQPAAPITAENKSAPANKPEVKNAHPLPEALAKRGFTTDPSGAINNPGYEGKYQVLTEPRDRFIDPGTIILTAPDGTQRYLKPGADPLTGWQPYRYHSVSTQEITDNRKALGLPEKLVLGSDSIVNFNEKNHPNLAGKGFYQVENKEGKTLLLRQGKPGTYILNQDGSVTYTWPNQGTSKLKVGGNPDKNEDWTNLDDKGKEAADKTKFKNTLEAQHFYYSEDGKLRREGYKGFYTIQPDQSIVYTWPNGGKSQLDGNRDPSGNLADDKWKPLDEKAVEARAEIKTAKETLVNIGPGQYVSLERARELGFAKPSKISDAEVMINQFTQGQKQDMLKALLEGKELSDLQKMRLQQIGILKTALQALRTDIKTSRTWGEWDRQVNEFEGTTNARLLWVDNKIQELDQVAAKVLEDPNVTIGQLVDGDTKRFLLDHKLNETAPFLMDAQGRIKEANSLGELQGQYFGLVQFLRDKKDYASAQSLIEENLLGPQFAAKRKELTQKQQDKAEGEASKKIYKMASSCAEDWTKQGMSAEQQSGYIKALIGEETKRGLNKAVAEINKGVPFDKETGWNKAIMESYKDMMGTGEWYNLSDSTWDTIIEETLINAPLIIASGGVASLARAGITAGARSLVAAARLTRFGIAATRVAEGIEATGAFGKALYWSGNKLGSAAGLLVEGATFETVYSGLHGENLFEGGWEKFPQWGKRIFWSSMSLGAFHVAGEAANKVNNVVLKYVSKFPDKSVGAAIQKLITTGSAETAAMLGIGAVQHYMENGNLNDFNFSNELFHALISVGALKVAGGAIEIGNKRFFPGTESIPVVTSDASKVQAPEFLIQKSGDVSRAEVEGQNATSNEAPNIETSKDGNSDNSSFESGESKAKPRRKGQQSAQERRNERRQQKKADGDPTAEKAEEPAQKTDKKSRKQKKAEQKAKAAEEAKKDNSSKAEEAKAEAKTEAEAKRAEEAKNKAEAEAKAKAEAEAEAEAEAKRIEAQYKKLKFEHGDRINVKGTDGSVESNWFIFNENPDGRVIVAQTSPSGKLTTKSLTKAALLQENPNGPHKKAADHQREQEAKRRQDEARAREEQRRQSEQKAREEQERRANDFKIGDEVLMERRDGSIEGGWKIIHIDKTTGLFSAEKEINGQRFTKKATYEELKSWKEQGPRKAPSSNRNSQAAGPNGEELFSNGKLKSIAEISKMTPKEISDLQVLAKGLDFAQRIFGLKDGFSEGDLKKSYRKLSMEFHPDRNSGSKQASEMFKVLGEAKSTLDAYLERYARKAA